LLPLLESLRQLGLSLGCNECEDRRAHLGDYCDACPRKDTFEHTPAPPTRQRERDDSIVLL
jgi:hypothetical protein